MTSADLLTDTDCYRAVQARDARFDGRFVTGVTSTGIYCRPVCSARLPKRDNCRFFSHAAQAEADGFRPCLRCRPELAPQSVAWSVQDASFMLADQAARLLDAPDGWAAGSAPPVAALAARMGITARHVHRIFESRFGVSPLQYLQTRRLLTAKQLLTDTDLPVTQVALASGFSSVRRFNAAFSQHYRLNPTQLRRQGDRPAGSGIVVRLGYRPPYDVAVMQAFVVRHNLAGTDAQIDTGGHTWAGRTVRIEHSGQAHTGWLLARFDAAENRLQLQIADSLRQVLPLLLRRVRGLYDLDADPAAIDRVLEPSFPGAGGLRVPGCIDGFELAVRAVLGQQITVAAARTLAQRLVDQFGEPLATPWPLLNRLFPTPAALVAAGADALGRLGVVRQRQGAILAMAQAVASGQLQLHGNADVPATIAALKALPGIGDWTAQYIAMRALQWPDAFPAGDVALHKALGLQGSKQAARQAEQASQPWKPWRSYAVIRAWSGCLAGPAAPPVLSASPASPAKPDTAENIAAAVKL